MADFNLDETFDKASKYLQQNLTSKLNSDQLLVFYGLYKQVTVGPCNVPKPKWYETKAKHKWEAWNRLNDTTKEQAMLNYIEELTRIDSNWQDYHNASTGKGWIAVSRLPNTEIELNASEKTFFDWVKEGNEMKICEMIRHDSNLIHIKDSEGLLPIHWAADRGHTNVLQCLIQNGADVDSRDADGQTALHYAAACGHSKVTKYLISVGARSFADNNGIRPDDLADEIVSAMF